MSPKKTSLWFVNLGTYILNFMYAFCFYFILHLQVWIRIRIRITDPDPQNSWIRIRIHNTAKITCIPVFLSRFYIRILEFLDPDLQYWSPQLLPVVSVRFAGLMKQMLELVYYGFLTKERLYHMRLSSVLSLCRLFVLCARSIASVLHNFYLFRSHSVQKWTEVPVPFSAK